MSSPADEASAKILIIIVFLVIAVIWIILAFVCSNIAKSKNRNQGAWFLLGLLLGIIALIIIAITPTLPDYSQQGYPLQAGPASAQPSSSYQPYMQYQAQQQTPQAAYKKCPFCAEPILRDALMCKHCRSSLVGTVKKDVVVNQKRVFSEGDQVLLLEIKPLPEQPKYKYSVYSTSQNDYYLLSDEEIVFQ